MSFMTPDVVALQISLTCAAIHPMILALSDFQSMAERIVAVIFGCVI